MKSKMKLAFALIAVALMVMVAVVPMIGVFTSNSDATSTADPELKAGEPIVIKGKVYDVSGSGITTAATGNGYRVLITWGSDSQYYVLESITGGSYETTVTANGLYEKSITNVKVCVVYGTAVDYEVAAEFGDVKTFSSLTSGTYFVNFQSGNSTSAAIAFYMGKQNNDNKYYSVFTDVDTTAGEYLAVDYVLYKSETISDANKVGSGTVAISSSSTAAISYKGIYTTLYAIFGNVMIMSADGSTIKTYEDITTPKVSIISNSTVNAIADQQLLKITTGNIAVPEGTISSIKAYYQTGSGTELVRNEVALKVAAGTGVVYSGKSTTYYYTKYDASTTETPDLKCINAYDSTLSWNSKRINIVDNRTNLSPSSTNNVISTEIGEGQIADDKAYFGSIAMGTVPADGQQILNMNLATYTEATTTEPAKYTKGASLTVFVGSDGNFIALAPSTAPETESYLYVAYTNYVVTSIKAVPINTVTDIGYTTGVVAYGAADIAIDAKGFTLVYGEILQNLQNDNNIDVELGITISGVTKAFGAKVSTGKIDLTTKVVTDSNVKHSKYAVYINTGDSITFTPATGEKFTLAGTCGGPYIVVSDTQGGMQTDLTIAEKKMVFKVTDGDALNVGPSTGTAGVVINYDADSLLAEALGGTYVTSIYNSTYKTHTVPVYKSYYDLTNAEFYPTFTGYTFANDVDNQAQYKETSGYMALSALDTTYTIYLQDINGNIVKSSSGTTTVTYNALFTASLVTLYETEKSGIIITTDSTVTYTVTADVNGKMTVKVPSTYVNVEIPKSMDAVKAVQLKPVDTGDAATVLDGLYLDSKYLLTPTLGTMVITANEDTMTAKVVKLDGVTGISGVNVKLYPTTTTTGDDYIAETVTDSTGSFTVNSPKKIADDFTYKFTTDDYDIADASALIGTKKATLFTSTKDPYYVTITDADKAAVKLTNGYKLTINGDTGTVAYGILKIKTALVDGTVITPTYTTGGDTPTTVRTFSPYTVQASDIKNGMLELVSNESTYTVTVVDSEGAKLPGYAPTVSVIENGKIIEEVGQFTAVKDGSNVYKGVLSALDSSRSYAVTAMTAGDYDFTVSYLYAEFENNAVTVESLMTKVTFALTDAAGEFIPVTAVPLKGANTPATLKYSTYYDDVAISANAVTGTLSFIGIEGVEYQFESTAYLGASGTWTQGVPETYTYSFDKTTKLIDGSIAAEEEAVVFSVVDALGLPITDAKATITPYNAAGTAQAALVTNVDLSDAGTITKIFDTSKYATYALTLTNATATAAANYYTFDKIAGTMFVADQCSIVPTFATANGYDLDSEVEDETTVTAYNAVGTPVGRPGSFAVDAGVITATPLIVDVEEAAYYKITAGGIDDFTFGDSETPVFVANESVITGTVPATDGIAYAKQDVYLELYLEDSLVNTVVGIIDPIYQCKYTAILDLSNYIIDGVSFDTIVAVYSENGVEIGSAVVDPFTAVNNIVSPFAQQFEVELVAPSAIVALHVNSAQVGNTVTVTADGKFIVADDESIYTDGQYIYTFAGWYVDNELVSPNPVFTFTMTENVMISPQYTVVYEKTSDVNKDVEKEYVNIVEKVEVPVEKTVGIDTNVLIIGICAVIVALIAVVYAVIKKD